MTANETASGSTENAADDDSIAYSPEWTERTFADLDFTCVETKQHSEAAAAVGTKGDAVSLEIRQSAFVTVFSVMDADTAEWLADELRDHADAVRNE